ncbi:MAG TPA: porin family protein [Burkholderiales bacterium]|nr:porin family protein [Burkholderiales bacterium]
MKRKSVLLAAAVVFCGAAAFHARAESGLYLGGGIGQATVKDSTSAGEFDADNAAYKAFIGYRFGLLPIVDLAAEGGYVDFGKPSQDLGAQHVEFKLHGAYAAGLVIFPLGPIDLYGKGGVIEAKTESSVGATTSSRSGSSGFYGVGAGFRIWKIGVRAEYERYQIKDVDRVQMFSVSALFQF